MRSNKIYISGPMSGIPYKNFPLFDWAALWLDHRGYSVLSPADIDRLDKRDDWEECLRRDIIALMDCTHVATLSGWRKSRGAKLEVSIAKALGMEVHPINYYLRRK